MKLFLLLSIICVLLAAGDARRPPPRPKLPPKTTSARPPKTSPSSTTTTTTTTTSIPPKTPPSTTTTTTTSIPPTTPPSTTTTTSIPPTTSPSTTTTTSTSIPPTTPSSTTTTTTSIPPMTSPSTTTTTTSTSSPPSVTTGTELLPEEIAAFKSTLLNVELSQDSSYYTVTSNGLPTHESQFENHNGNDARPQNFQFEIPAVLEEADTPGCLPQGPIAIATNGVALFNPWSAICEDAVINEGPTFDQCNGHADQFGVYHFHGPYHDESGSSCPLTSYEADHLVGWAFDGYPIYGPLDSEGNTITNGDLDACHGRMETVDGQQVYRYRITYEFPYMLACYHGKTIGSTVNQDRCMCTK